MKREAYSAPEGIDVHNKIYVCRIWGFQGGGPKGGTAVIQTLAGSQFFISFLISVLNFQYFIIYI